MNQFQSDLKDYILSGHALLNINTPEPDRAVQQIKESGDDIKRKTFIWSIAHGWTTPDGIIVDKENANNTPELAITYINNMSEDSIFILKEFGFYTKHETYSGFDVVLSLLDENKQVYSNRGQIIIFLGADFEIPVSLKCDITELDFPLPDKDQIIDRVKFVCESVGKDFELDEKLLPEITASCKGLSSQQIIDKTALAIVKRKQLDHDAIKIILKEKANVIKNSGFLTYKDPPAGGLSIVGGASALKNHLMLDRPCFTEEAREYGIDYPKGLVLAGIAGTGKSLFCLAIASYFELPLVGLDIGAIFGSLVGESEKNMRQAIKLIDSIAPAVVMIDEVEKAFGGQGDLDSGSSKRVLGTFLSWMNDRTSPIYVVATANDVSVLPPEFCRAGRFDAIFGISLPSQNEREDIFKIHLSKRKRDPNKFNIEKLAGSTNDFSGADIEAVVKLGLKIAFQQKQEVNDNHLLTAIDSTIPLARVEPQKINATKEWINKHAKLANPQEAAPTKEIRRRVAVNR